jgi:hypothetical protein
MEAGLSIVPKALWQIGNCCGWSGRLRAVHNCDRSTCGFERLILGALKAKHQTSAEPRHALAPTRV